jgi:hypothetical protein
METLTCDLCGCQTHDDTSEVFEVYSVGGVALERHCFDCDPADAEVA